MGSKRPKDKNAPKKPSTGYILFGNHVRATNQSIKELPINQQMSEIGKLWKEADPETKKKYEDEAMRHKAEYQQKMEEYKKSPEYQEFMEEKKKNKGDGKEKRKRTGKISGYQLFISENKDMKEEDMKDPDLSGKSHMERCSIKWKRLSEEQKGEYNTKAANMVSSKANVDDDDE